MNIVRFTPWNWFGGENTPVMHMPVRQTPRHAGRTYDPFHEMERVFDALMGITKNGAGASKDAQSPVLRPSLDVTGNDKQYTVTVELPGVDEKDLRVEMENNSLRIFGEKKQEFEEEGEGENKGGYYRMERSYGSFQRVLTLPDDVDASAIKAAHKDGVLTITLPRKEEALPESKVIAINND